MTLPLSAASNYSFLLVVCFYFIWNLNLRWSTKYYFTIPRLQIELNEKSAAVIVMNLKRWKQIPRLKIWVSQWMREVPYSNLCSEQVTWEGPSFISFLHLLPRAICRALTGCRNIITALMHTLKLSSFDLTSWVFQYTKCFWRDLHTATFMCRL